MYHAPASAHQSPFRSPRRLALWVLLTTAAGLIGSLIAFDVEQSRRQLRAGLLPNIGDVAMDGFIGGGIVGALVGGAQLAVLVPALASSFHWLAASFGGRAAGIYLARYVSWGRPDMIWVLLSGIVAGTVAGAVQLPALRSLRLGGWWLLASAVGSALNWAVLRLLYRFWNEAPDMAERMVAWSAGWLIYALITALVLYRRAAYAIGPSGQAGE